MVVEMLQDNELYHHGILGQRWGIRRFQNPDGSLTDAGKRHYEKADQKWAARKRKKSQAKVERQVAGDMKRYNKELSKQAGYYNKDRTVSKAAVNAYNRKMAQLMNERVGNIEAPSGRVVRFVAKRSEFGVQMALADPSYNMSAVKNGVWANGRVAYRKKTVGKINV